MQLPTFLCHPAILAVVNAISAGVHAIWAGVHPGQVEKFEIELQLVYQLANVNVVN